MRVFVASLATGTNTFAPLPTDHRAFETALYRPPNTHPDTHNPVQRPNGRSPRATGAGHEMIEGTATWAEPAGLVGRGTYEGLRDEILDQLRAALPVNIVLFGLHGCMVAVGYGDCEGDLLAQARALAPTAVIGAELDLHAHLTPAMVAYADLLVAFYCYDASCSQPMLTVPLRALQVGSRHVRRARRGQLFRMTGAAHWNKVLCPGLTARNHLSRFGRAVRVNTTAN